MGRPQNNGLVELVDEKPNMDRSSWNCMDFWLARYTNEQLVAELRKRGAYIMYGKDFDCVTTI